MINSFSKLFGPRNALLLVLVLFLIGVTPGPALANSQHPGDQLTHAISNSGSPDPDNPEEAVRFRRLQLQDEHGIIPPDALLKAAEHVKSMQSAQGRQPKAAGISPGAWSWLGPGNIGGRIRSIVINPAQPTTMFVGSVGGGIWKTTNSGSSWQPVNDFMANLAVSTMMIDPTNSNIMYAGTGEGFFNIDAIRGAGVFKSTDGGTTWTQLSSTTSSEWYYVNRLAISQDASILLSATMSGIFRSTDGGSTWTKVSTTNTFDLAFNPINANFAIASGAFGSAWYSTDGGSTWFAATGLPSLTWLGRVEVAYAPSNPSIVYAGVGNNNGEVWKSTDGGHSYSLVNTGANYLGGQAWYDNAIWVDPTNFNTIVVGGPSLFRSTNGGVTLTDIGGYSGGIHPDQHAIVNAPGFNGSSNTAIYVGNDGGIFSTLNIYTVSPSNGWQSLNHNLGITQFYGAAGNAMSGVIVGGTQDNGTLRYVGGTNNWTSMFGGDGGFAAADNTDPNYFYGEYVNLRIHRSTNGGLSSGYIYSGISDAGTGNANFIAPFVLDPNNPNTLLAGGSSLWRSTNVKASSPAWSAISPPIGTNISAIAVAPGNSDIIWVGYNDGRVYKTTNGTSVSPMWSPVDDNSSVNPLPNRYVTRLTIDRNSPNIVYATFGGYSPDNVWVTSDGGTTWSLRVGSGVTGLPQAPVRSLVINPNNSNWIYVGTEVGVFDSQDGGVTWTVPQDGPANVSVDELFWMNSTLVAATHGRGLFSVNTAAMVAVTSVWTTDGNGNTKTVFSPGDSIRYYGSVYNSTGGPVTAYFSWAANGPCGSIASWTGNLGIGAGSSALDLPAAIPNNACAGTYTYSLSVTYNSVTSSQSTTFTVNGIVTVTSVWTTDGNGNTKTVFRPGDSIRYYGSVYNNTGGTVTAYLSWAVNGPCGSIASWTGNLSVGTGTRTWFLPSTIPNNACGGAYTLSVNATYNGGTSSKSTNFTINNWLFLPLILK